MMTNTRILAVSLVLLLCAPVFGQRIVSDTSLTYSAFLTQCTEFKSRAKQEIWVVHFWASWNSPSLSVMDGLITARAMYQDKPVRFVGIAVDKNKALWLERLSQYNLAWEQMFLPDQDNYDFLRRAFKHNSLPGIFIVNTQGQIQRVRDINELIDMLKNITPSLPNRPYTSANPAPFTDARTQPTPGTPPPKTQATPAASGSTYTVKSGDTLFGIYKTTGVPVETIKKLNGMRDNSIRVGQVLKLK